MASTVYGRLGYNFDDTLYGDNFALTEQGKKTITMQSDSVQLQPWQIADIASGDAGTRTNYYKNPHATVCSTLRASAVSILNIANTYTFANVSNSSLYSSASNCIIEVDKFKSHTDNVSGVSDYTTFTNRDARYIPTLDSASGIGNGLIVLVNKTDGVLNSSPMLGCMTSLFIGPYLTSNNTILINDLATLNATLNVSSTTDANGNVITTYVSNISSAAANTIIADLNSVTTLLNTRRTHDWNFFQQATITMQYHGQMKRFNSMGGSEANLVINLIGTDRLTANL